MALSACPLTLGASQLQRVADVMFQYGLLHRKLTMSPMILPKTRLAEGRLFMDGLLWRCIAP